jgi:hypothetical protein
MYFVAVHAKISEGVVYYARRLADFRGQYSSLESIPIKFVFGENRRFD